MDMLEYGSGLRSGVCKVSHHGSLSSSSVPFVDLVRAEYAVFSAGRENKYGLPVYDVITRYEEKGAEIPSTEEMAESVEGTKEKMHEDLEEKGMKYQKSPGVAVSFSFVTRRA